MHNGKAHTPCGPRALLIYAALACLLCSDGVGPRLVPYPTPRVAPVSSAAGSVPELLAPVRNSRERALVNFSLKLEPFKLGEAGKQHAPAGLAALHDREAAATVAPPDRRRAPRPPVYRQPSARAHTERGPPSLS